MGWAKLWENVVWVHFWAGKKSSNFDISPLVGRFQLSETWKNLISQSLGVHTPCRIGPLIPPPQPLNFRPRLRPCHEALQAPSQLGIGPPIPLPRPLNFTNCGGCDPVRCTAFIRRWPVAVRSSLAVDVAASVGPLLDARPATAYCR